MKRYVSAAAIALLAVAPLVAQAPKGWKVRADRSTSASDPDAAGSIKFLTMGTGFHAINPQAAVYWNPAHTATGTYTLKGTFTLMNYLEASRLLSVAPSPAARANPVDRLRHAA